MKYEIVADFDGTLIEKGQGKTNSFMAFFDTLSAPGKVFSEQIYTEYAHKEFDETIPLPIRNQLMAEWWIKEFEGYILHKSTKQDVLDTAQRPDLKFRDGASDLFDFARESSIPILIFTAGLADIIEMKLEKESLLSDNVRIVGNRFVFDDDGLIIDYVRPIVYVGNKHLIAQTWDAKVHADTAFLLGDHPTDVQMCEDANHGKVIRFGFLNGKSNDNGAYDAYDYLYESGDASMMPLLDKIKEIVL